MPSVRPASVDVAELDRRLAQSSFRSKAELAQATHASARAVQLLFSTGKGNPDLVFRVFRKLGVPPAEMASLLRPHSGDPRPRSLPIDLNPRLLEGFMMSGRLDVVRKKVQDLRGSGQFPELAEYFEAELAKWVGDFDAAGRSFERLSRVAADPGIRLHAAAGLLRIARERNQVAAANALQRALERNRSTIDPRSYVASLLTSIRAWVAQSRSRYDAAAEGMKRALKLAADSGSRIERLKRLIDYASVLRKRHLASGAEEDLHRAGGAYLDALSAASAENCYTYVSSAFNGLARLAEHEATIAERKGDEQMRKVKLADAETLLKQAVELAEYSEHAGMIAIAVGCLGIVKRRQGDFAAAIEYSTRSLKLEEQMGRAAYAQTDRLNLELASRRSTQPMERT